MSDDTAPGYRETEHPVRNASELATRLQNLIKYKHDALDACETALQRLDDATKRSRLREFIADHRRHDEQLGEFMRELGETPPPADAGKSVLPQGKVMLAGLAGDDSILKALHSNSEHIENAYEHVLSREGIPASIRSALQQQLSDVRSHGEWLQQHT